MKTSNNLTTAETLHLYEYGSNGLSVTILNNRDFYCQIEALAMSCTKIARKIGGLDLNIIENCSTLKAITRNARKWLAKQFNEVYNMDDDRTARTELTYYIAEYAFTSLR